LGSALETGRGAIVWESPFGARALGRIALAERGIPLTLLRGPNHGAGPSRFGQRWIRALHRRAERELGFDTIDIQAESAAYLAEVRARLRRNGVVCVSSFGPMARRFVVLPFLGVEQCFAVGVPSLAYLTGAALIPASCIPLGDGRYKMVLEPAVPMRAEEGLEEMQLRALRHYAGLMEKYVERYPDQWLRWGDRLTPDREYFREATLIDGTESQPGEGDE
jgi:lauroyl/myristoyl acyltransferase